MRTTIITALLILPFCVHAQIKLQSITNALRADSINKETICYVAPFGEGENVTWDLSQIQTEETPDTTSIAIYDIGDRVLWDDNGRMDTYTQSADSLLMVRTETPLYEMDYHKPVIALTFPFGYGKTVSNAFAGKGIYEGKFAVEEDGTASIAADGYGTLILAAGDTLRNVLRLHTSIMSDIDISNRYTAEHIATLRRLTDTYRWYARGYRHAVLETIEDRIMQDADTVADNKVTHRISPDMQTTAADWVNDSIRMHDSKAEKGIISYSLQVKGYSAELVYDLHEDTHVEITLCNAQGIVYRRYAADQKAGNGYHRSIPLSGLYRGQYVIYITAGVSVCSAVVSVE